MPWVPQALAFIRWDVSHPVSKRRLFMFLSMILVLLSWAIFLGSASLLTVKPASFQAPQTLVPAEVDVYAEAISIDPMTRTIVMEWYPMIPTSQYKCSEYLTNPFIREFYVPRSMMDPSSPGWSVGPPFPPLFTFNSTEQCLGLDGSSIRTSFRTITKLIATRDGSLGPKSLSSLQNYPFDVYSTQFAISVRNPVTGSTKAPRVSRFLGVVPNFEISLSQSSIKPDSLQNDQLIMVLHITRSKAVQVFVVTAAIITWLATTAFLIIVAAALVYRHHKICVGMFVVPVGALLVFFGIRANIPGSPALFGTTLDMFSILPVLIIMTLSTFALILIMLRRRTDQLALSQGTGKECSADDSLQLR